MSYSFNGINISNLISLGSDPTSVPGYTGFPESTPFLYGSGLDKPYNFSYMYDGIDVSNYTTAYNLSFTSAEGATIPTAIGNTGYSFKHIAGYCFGGGGGGGGGGGTGADGPNLSNKSGGKGGKGGAGGYAAILSTPLQGSPSVLVIVGGGGSGGSGGPGNPGKDINDYKGTPGKGGDAGGASYIQIPGISTLAEANGGGGGGGGDAGTSKDSGGGGGTGSTGDGSILGPGNTAVETGYPNVPSSYQAGEDGGDGGSGGNVGDVRNGSPGGKGLGGYVQIYFSYQ
jgi:hypothetical protein